jgi:hypothetical protein
MDEDLMTIPERVQTGVRIEKRMLKVLKALAEYLDLSLGELLEIIVLQSFDGSRGFSKGTLRRIAELKKVYDMDWDSRTVARMMFVGQKS